MTCADLDVLFCVWKSKHSAASKISKKSMFYNRYNKQRNHYVNVTYQMPCNKVRISYKMRYLHSAFFARLKAEVIALVGPAIAL